MYYAKVWGHGTYEDSDKELAFLDAKRYSSGEYQDTEVHVYRDKTHVRTYYNGYLSEDFEADFEGD